MILIHSSRKIQQFSNAEFLLSQAILPAVLAGLYNLSRTDEGVRAIAENNIPANWAANFLEKKKLIASNISTYTYSTASDVHSSINQVATAAVEIIREHAGEKEPLTHIKNIVGNQRNNILPFLLAELHVGDLLEDDTLDDLTNKMEGPISSLMHKIESGFSGN